MLIMQQQIWHLAIVNFYRLIKSVISSSGVVHHCAVRLLCLLCLSTWLILIMRLHFLSTWHLFIWSNYFFIRLINEYLVLYETGELFAASNNSSFFQSVSVLFALRMIGLYFDCGPWQQSVMFSACWDDWCDRTLSSWIFQCQLCECLCEVPSTPKILPHVSGTNRVALLFMAF